MKAFQRLFAVLFVLTFLVTACAQPTAAPTEAPTVQEPAAPATEKPAEPAAPAETAAPVEPTQAEAPGAVTEPIELEFWTMLGGDLGERVKEMIADYNASQDLVTINEVNMGDYEPLLEKQLAAVVAGNLPPVTLIDYKTVPFFAREGILEPIANWASEEDMNDFMPELLSDLTYDGVVYALPFNRSYQGLYYNKDIFRAAGLDPEKPPTTWEEYTQYVDQINAMGTDVKGTYVFRRSHEFFLSFGEMISNDECNVTVNSDKGVEALQFLSDLHYKHEGVVPANLSGPFAQAAIEFIQGKVAFYSGSIGIQPTVAKTVDFDYGFTLLPAGPGGQAWLGGGGNIAIPASGTPEQKAAAWDFVKWVTSQEQSAKWHMGTGYLPTRLSVAELPEVQAFYKDHPSWPVSVEGVKGIVKTPCAIVNIPQYVSITTPFADQVVLNGEDPKAIANELQAALQLLIDQARQENTLIIPK
jgi:sn-glycerol 3-phosphate transport system substrate-binding protein